MLEYRCEPPYLETMFVSDSHVSLLVSEQEFKMRLAFEYHDSKLEHSFRAREKGGHGVGGMEQSWGMSLSTDFSW